MIKFPVPSWKSIFKYGMDYCGWFFDRDVFIGFHGKDTKLEMVVRQTKSGEVGCLTIVKRLSALHI